MNIRNLSWTQKFLTIPKLPRGSEGYLASLKIIINMIESMEDTSKKVKIKDSINNMTLEQACVALNPLHIVQKNPNRKSWILTDEFKMYANHDLQEFISIFLSSKLKFFTELLAFLEEPKTIQEIYQHATIDFQINWSGFGPIYDRISWLKDLELIDHIDYRQSYVINSRGKKLIKEIPPYTITDLTNITADETSSEAPLKLSESQRTLVNFNWEDTDSRQNSLSHAPGGLQNTFNAIEKCLDSCIQLSNSYNITEQFNTYLNLKRKTVETFLRFLTRINYLDLKGRQLYLVNNNGLNYLGSESKELDLILTVHFHYRYILEILFELENKELSLSEVTRIGYKKYGLDSINEDQGRVRINLLRITKMIMHNGKNKYKLTNRGESLLKILKNYYEMKKTLIHIDSEEKSNCEDNQDYFDWILHIRNLSINPSKYQEFEKEIEKVFKFLGYKTQLFGTSGTTDILATPNMIEKYNYSIAIDTKTNSLEQLRAENVSFEAIKEHRIKHEADFSLIISNNFSGETIVKRAIDNNVSLMNLDDLERLIYQHINFPLNLTEYRILFEEPGNIDIDKLSKIIEKRERNKNLISLVIDELNAAYEDEFDESKGELTPREIYFSLKKVPTNNEIPYSIAEIKDMLDLLSNPLIEAIGSKNNEKYYAKGGVEEASLKFNFYLKSLQSL